MRTLAGFFAAVGLMGHLSAATLPVVNLAWNPNPESDIAGYEVSYGTASGQYPTHLDVGLKTTAAVSGLNDGATYYFVVSAYNQAGLKSQPSDEVAYTGTSPLTNQAPDGAIVTPSTGGTITVGQSVSFSGNGSDPAGDTALTYRWNFGAGSGIADSTAKDPGARQFNSPGTYQVTFTVVDSQGLADPSPDTRTITVLGAANVIPHTSWKLTYVDSQEAGGFDATRAFDGDPGTFWHTQFKTTKLPLPPHEIQINLGSVCNVNGFTYLPRQDGISVGNIGKYEFYVSMDGVSWGRLAASGSFANTAAEKQVLFTARSAQYVRLRALTEANGGTECNVAELNILQVPPLNRAPVAEAAAASTPQGTAVNVVLKGSDPDLNPLTYQIVGSPQNGTLTGIPPALTYTPANAFSGTDRFTFRIFDGLTYSTTMTVTIQVTATTTTTGTGTGGSGGTTSPGTTPVPLAPPTISTDLVGRAKYLTLSTAKPAVPDGLTRTVEVSSNLVDWFSGPTYTTVITDNETFLKVRDKTPFPADGKRYIRLKTSTP